MVCEGAGCQCCNGLPPQPFVQVCMTCPPPGPLPTCPCPVKPLQLPCPAPHCPSPCKRRGRQRKPLPSWQERECGTTFDGKSPNCVKCPYAEPPCCSNDGCPTGFKPCTMKLLPPPCCNPCGVWCAQIQPCPPKAKKVEFDEDDDY